MNGTAGTAGAVSTTAADNSPPPGVPPSTVCKYPTLALVSSFGVGGDGMVEWETASEVGTVGFNLLRQDAKSGQWVRVNDALLPALMDAPQGGAYRYPDRNVSVGQTYTYQLEEVEVTGETRTHGPYTVTAGSGRSLAPPIATDTAPRTDGFESQVHAPDGRTLPRAERSLMATPQAAKAGTAARILVEQEGLYLVTAAQIATALGASPAQAQAWIQSGQLRLQNRGQTVDWLASTGNTGLYFYGQPISSVYTRHNVYWLDRQPGSRMTVKPGQVPTTGATCCFLSTAHVEENKTASPSLAQNPDADFWYWNSVVAKNPPASVQFTVPTPGATATGTVTLRTALHGATDLSTGNDHNARILVNGSEVGSAVWDGITPYLLNSTFSASLLKNGDNTFTVSGTLDPGVSASVFRVNSFDIRYPRAYQAVNNQLRLSGNGNAAVTVGGFNNPAIAVLDIANPRKPQWLKATAISPANGGYAVRFTPATPTTNYLAAVAAAPVSVVGDTPSTLKTNNSGAEYLVLTPTALRAGADALAAHRSGKVVELQDIYNAFNYGIADPNAIRAFLSHAYQKWQPRPRFVALLGKGTFDPKDYQGKGTNLFPVLMATTPNGLFASDNRYADLNNDGIPDLRVGRIPALTNADAQNYVAKLQSYAASKTALVLADDPDEGGDFIADSQVVASALQAKGFAVTPIYFQTGASAAQTRLNILARLNAGVGLFNYVGHGGSGRLASDSLLVNADVSQLTNSQLPLFLAFTCMVGNGSYPGYDSLVETLLWRQGGGIVAAFAPTGLSDNSQAHVLNLGITNTLFGAGASPTLGDAAAAAKASFARQGGERYMLDIYQVFGDPALVVKP